jgi:hypothetical protein
MGCSVRFAGNPIRTKERRIEGLTGQRCAARGKSQRKTRRVESAGSKSAFSGVSLYHRIGREAHKHFKTTEAQKALTDNEKAQETFHKIAKRLKSERLAREMLSRRRKGERAEHARSDARATGRYADQRC